jgi:hypothetical protein
MTTSPTRKATPVTRAAATAPTGQWRDRVEAANWTTIRADLDDYGCALTGPLLTDAKAADIAALCPTTPGSAPP